MSKALAFVIVGLLAYGTAWAGLATDLNAYVDGGGTTWHGTTNFYKVDPLDPDNILAADIEWCVYAAGDFTYTGAGYTPTPGEFVYAYQVISTSNGTAPINVAWVNMLSSNETNNIGSFSLPGGTAAAGTFTPPAPAAFDKASWTFSASLDPATSDVSDGLVYSSINEPLNYLGGIHDGGLFDVSAPLPSPSDVIPEPATVILLLLAAGVSVSLRHRSRA